MSEKAKDSLISSLDKEIYLQYDMILNRDSVIDAVEKLNVIQAEVITEQKEKLIKKKTRLPFLIIGSAVIGLMIGLFV